MCSLCVVLALSGCVQIKEQVSGVLDPVQAAATAAPLAHDLKIAAIELGSSAAEMADGNLSLMVVIGNNGSQAESEVPVSVRLSDTNDQVVYEATEYCRTIAAGDTAIVSFQGQVSETAQPRYQLHVEVGTVAGESRTENNIRVYDISVNQR